jgi:hypothetical protein
MKKTAFISGIISANLVMFGSLFKTQHWPFAGILLVAGIIIFSFVFLPTALYSWYQSSEKKSILLPVMAFIVFFFGPIATLFKIQHWPHGSQLLMLSLPLPFILFLPVYLMHSGKEKDKTFFPVMLGLVFVAVFGVLLSQ